MLDERYRDRKEGEGRDKDRTRRRLTSISGTDGLKSCFISLYMVSPFTVYFKHNIYEYSCKKSEHLVVAFLRYPLVVSGFDELKFD